MSLDITIECSKISEMSVTRMGEIEIELVNADLTDAVSIETIIEQYGTTELLNEMNETEVISWIKSQGYTVTQ